MNLKIGTNLRRIRRSKKITQFELAEKLGINRSSISTYECCAGNPSLDIFIRICEILDCTPNELLGV